MEGSREVETKGSLRRSIPVIVLLAILPLVLMGQGKGKPEMADANGAAARVTGSPTHAVLNVNNITVWMKHDGQSSRPPSGDPGIFYPRGTASVVYRDGFVWGGKMYRDAMLTRPASDQTIRVGGGDWNVGTRAGRIIGNGATAVAEDTLASSARIYRIRRDYVSMSDGDLWQDASVVFEATQSSVTFSQANAVRAQYAADWAQWPVDRGAPFIDRNGNGIYDPPPPFNEVASQGPIFTVDSLVAQGRDEPGVAGGDPNSPADQVIWTVYNDLDSSTTYAFSCSNPIGLEIQKTMWAYERYDELGNVAYMRVRIINKGGVDTSETPGKQGGTFWIDSMYVGIWSDPDIGNAGDDLAGCDVRRSMGYAYNGNRVDDIFGSFKLPPPAVGYDLLAGPAVAAPGDSGFFDLRWRHGIRNLGMSAFTVMGVGDIYSDPAPATYDTTVGKWWKLLRGYAPQGTLSTPDIPYPSGPYAASPYRFSGDPMQLPGDVDGLGTLWSFPPGDRCTLMSSGPFRMAPGDTQEVYWSVAAGLHRDPRSGIAVMRLNADVAQTVFDRRLQIPMPPSAPKVTATPLDGTIVLNWGFDPATVRATEERVMTETYEFEGYVVYQLPSSDASIEEGVRIATFDRVNGRTVITTPKFDYDLDAIVEKPVQIGTDGGIRRSLVITEDLLNGPVIAGVRVPVPLANGRECHFAVVAYNVSAVPGSVPSTVSSTPIRVSVRSAIPFGLRSMHAVGDTLSVEHRAGAASTTILPIIVDPLAGMGDTLQVRFGGSGADWRWSVRRASNGEALTSGETNRSGDEQYPIVHGVLVKVVHDSTTGAPADSTNVYAFFVAAPQQGRSFDMSSVDRIGVFPNPYYADVVGVSSWWSLRQRQLVTFNNLPQRATIRIFNLAGHLVRTLYKDTPSQFLEWNLENEDGWLVASGIYVCHIELPDLGVAKVLKAAIITAEESVR